MSPPDRRVVFVSIQAVRMMCAAIESARAFFFPRESPSPASIPAASTDV
jgi:hypothetical protein